MASSTSRTGVIHMQMLFALMSLHACLYARKC